jgi:hypothetical protein
VAEESYTMILNPEANLQGYAFGEAVLKEDKNAGLDRTEFKTGVPRIANKTEKKRLEQDHADGVQVVIQA